MSDCEQPVFSEQDQHWMRLALRLAAQGRYTARPNPCVGCVIVKHEQKIGEGFHHYAGQPHAEVLALQQAGVAASGATAYVTLEPCAHHGRTPPCADALIQAGIARVVAALRDPFPAVNGGGFEKLRAAGIEVDQGVLEDEARELNRGFLSRIERHRPWVRIKLAASLDGRTALADGESKWITGVTARADVQHWRACSGAILTGAGTVIADDPSLTVRLDTAAAFVPPVRVVLDAQLRSWDRENVRRGDAPTWYFHSARAIVPKDLPRHVQFIAVSEHAGQLDLTSIMALLAERGINEIQVEAGATLCGALFVAELVDELLLYQAPVLLGEHARPLLSGLDIHHMRQRRSLAMVDTRGIGRDLRLLLRPSPIVDEGH